MTFLIQLFDYFCLIVLVLLALTAIWQGFTLNIGKGMIVLEVYPAGRFFNEEIKEKHEAYQLQKRKDEDAN